MGNCAICVCGFWGFFKLYFECNSFEIYGFIFQRMNKILVSGSLLIELQSIDCVIYDIWNRFVRFLGVNNEYFSNSKFPIFSEI